jgi:hypothetical protein
MDIEKFKNTVTDLARTNMFMVNMEFPDLPGLDTPLPEHIKNEGRITESNQAYRKDKDSSNLFSYMVKATSPPDSAVDACGITYARGRVINIPGVRKHQPFEIKCYADKNLHIYDNFIKWHYALNHPIQNKQLTNNVHDEKETDALKKTMYMTAIDPCEGKTFMTWIISGVFPTKISGINFDWSSNNILDFDVTLVYDYFIIDNLIGKGVMSDSTNELEDQGRYAQSYTNIH